MPLRLTVAFALSLLALTAPAGAATVSVDGSKILTYQAAEGERNALTVSEEYTETGRVLVFTEAEEKITAGSGCSQITAIRAHCAMTTRVNGEQVYAVMGMTYHLGDGNDSLRHETSIEIPVSIYGEDGNDNIAGAENSLSGVGVPKIYDLLDGGSGDDTLSGEEGPNRLYGGPGADDLTSGASNDILQGGGGDDNLNGGPGADELSGEDGNDNLQGGDYGSNLNADFFSGGSGTDTADYSAYGSGMPIVVTFNGRADDGTGGERDNVKNDIENLTGGGGDDTLNGTSGRNVLKGMFGNDKILGGGAADSIFGGSGDDSLTGGPGADKVSGEAGEDSLFLKDGGRDRGSCGMGEDRAKADKSDRLSQCERRLR